MKFNVTLGNEMFEFDKFEFDTLEHAGRFAYVVNNTPLTRNL